MKRNRVLWVGIVGALLIAQSTFWEYARMRPDFGFLVEPWSMRGTEMVHGSVSVAIGLGLVAGLVLASIKASERPAVGAAIAGVLALAAVVIAAVFADRELTITFSFIIQALAFVVITIVARRLIEWFFPDLGGWVAAAALLGSLVLGFVLSFLVLNGISLDVSAGMAVVVLMIPILALALSGEPRELIANRMLVMIAFAAILALGLQAGAIRQTLIDAQAAGDFGAPAEYKDSQVTSGYFWSQLGALMVFVSAVALWANRRDHILNVRRARSQREAAEASAREIRAALEAAGLGGDQ